MILKKKRLIKLFGTRIGLALVRSNVSYAILYDWYFQGILNVNNSIKNFQIYDK